MDGIPVGKYWSRFILPIEDSGGEKGMLFSIIIPVYNIENYVIQCVESVLAQEFRDYEVILVDDGSRDGSVRICDEYAQRCPHIKCIHKTNGGLSSARNTGIMAAKGDYLIFVDGDDWLPQDALVILKGLIRRQKDVDVIVSPFAVFDDSLGTMKEHPAGIYSSLKKCPSELFKDLYLEQNIPPNVWSLTVRREYLIQKSIFFKEGLLHEDELWTPQVLLGAKTAALNTKQTYVYRINRKGSIMDTFGRKNAEHKLLVIGELLAYFSKEEESGQEQLIRFRCSRILWGLICQIYVDGEISLQEEDCLERKINDYLYLFRSADKRKYRWVYVWIKLFGLRSLKCLSIVRKSNRR